MEDMQKDADTYFEDSRQIYDDSVIDVEYSESDVHDEEQAMLREARVYDKSEVYQLWKQSYPTLDRNYLNFYFKHLFDSGV